MSKTLWLIDAGHGGINDQGIYTTGNKKKYKFPDGLEIFEGQVNRQIAAKLEHLLRKNGIDFQRVYHDVIDTSLRQRVDAADRIFDADVRAIYLSIHSNSASATTEGEGTKAKGFEIYTSPGQTKSDTVAEIILKAYKKKFPKWKMRMDHSDGDGDKEANFYVLRKTDCPAVLVENLFFDNRKEAEFLISVEGQQQIAEALMDGILEVEKIWK
jgi:N-acetylmuramoyl-L-alanine amidase